MSDQRRHRAYVGAAAHYDIIGASQFALAVACGLREGHRLLDFGCGSLRAGRFFITYLRSGHYFGIEPNRWLVESAFTEEIGADILSLKAPNFAFVDNFSIPFDCQFDYIMAQSIFTHMGRELVVRLFRSAARALTENGIFLATFFLGDQDETRQGWIYFDTVPKGESVATPYREETVTALAWGAGLKSCKLPYHHPRGQTWFLFTKRASRLPSARQIAFLHGLQVMPSLSPGE